MTMVEDTLRPGCAVARDGLLVVEVRLPWYRSLPLSCLESVEVALAGRPVPVRAVAVRAVGTTSRQLPLAATGTADGDWDLRDPLEVFTDAPAQPGDDVDLEVAVAIRIPYLVQAPGVPLVQRVTVRHRDVVRPDRSAH